MLILFFLLTNHSIGEVLLFDCNALFPFLPWHSVRRHEGGGPREQFCAVPLNNHDTPF